MRSSRGRSAGSFCRSPSSLAPPTRGGVRRGDAGQSRKVRGIVLQVAIERRDEAPPGVGEAGRERRGLTEVAGEPEAPHPRIAALDITRSGERPIAAAIVDEDDFIRDAERIESA